MGFQLHGELDRRCGPFWEVPVCEELEANFWIRHYKGNMGTQVIFLSRGFIVICTKGCVKTRGNLDAGMN